MTPTIAKEGPSAVLAAWTFRLCLLKQRNDSLLWCCRCWPPSNATEAELEQVPAIVPARPIQPTLGAGVLKLEREGLTKPAMSHSLWL